MKVENIFYVSFTQTSMHYTINSGLLHLLSIKTLSCCWFTKKGRKKLIPIHQFSTYNTTVYCMGKRGFSNTYTFYSKIHTCSTSPLHNVLPYHSWIDSLLPKRKHTKRLLAKIYYSPQSKSSISLRLV